MSNITSSDRALHAVTLIGRQQAIENALAMALYFVRQPDNTQDNLWAATARTSQAFTLLNQASEGAETNSGRT